MSRQPDAITDSPVQSSQLQKPGKRSAISAGLSSSSLFGATSSMVARHPMDIDDDVTPGRYTLFCDASTNAYVARAEVPATCSAAAASTTCTKEPRASNALASGTVSGALLVLIQQACTSALDARNVVSKEDLEQVFSRMEEFNDRIAHVEERIEIVEGEVSDLLERVRRLEESESQRLSDDALSQGSTKSGRSDHGASSSKRSEERAPRLFGRPWVRTL